MLNINQIIKKLNLKPHPIEGGYYKETYRSKEIINKNLLPKKYAQNKSCSTAIYYLLTKNTFSEFHKLTTDEIFHFYLGDPLEIILLQKDGTKNILTLGNDLSKNQLPQIIVKKNIWQAATLKKGGNFCLMGTTVAPGFDYSDYKSGDYLQLSNKFPNHSKIIKQLTRK